jgi:hypothetical protein
LVPGAKTLKNLSFSFSLGIILLHLLYISPAISAEREFKGSASIAISQHFFTSGNFGAPNRFNAFPAPEVRIEFGVYEFDFGLEPIIGFSYINKTSKKLLAVNNALSEDKYEFNFFTIYLGARYKFFERNVFFIMPYVDGGLTYRFGRFKKLAAVKDGSDSSGGDVGGFLGAGAIFSFMKNKTRNFQMKRDWGVKDFGCQLFGRYLPAGLLKHGLGATGTTGGWEFGTGLYIDW